jgi:hypothetical protein
MATVMHTKTIKKKRYLREGRALMLCAWIWYDENDCMSVIEREEQRRERRAEGRRQRAVRREQRAESREQRAESREQRAESRESRESIAFVHPIQSMEVTVSMIVYCVQHQINLCVRV